MAAIKDILIKCQGKIDHLDTELIIAHEIGKTREFVLAHPEHKIPKFKIKNLKLKISRRRCGEPLAYILGHKEFYGLDFKVNKNVLIPRPETELLVELVISNLKLVIGKNQKIKIVDIGTGSGNIIISLAKKLEKSELRIASYPLLATDMSGKALSVARQNAKFHKVDKKIKFLQGDLLEPIIKQLLAAGGKSPVVITANLPYLSFEIYKSASKSVRKYEPKIALFSQNKGLWHYKKLLQQIKRIRNNCFMFHVSCFMEISPEQKNLLIELIKKYLPESKIKFYKDLANKWRVCEIKI